MYQKIYKCPLLIISVKFDWQGDEKMPFKFSASNKWYIVALSIIPLMMMGVAWWRCEGVERELRREWEGTTFTTILSENKYTGVTQLQLWTHQEPYILYTAINSHTCNSPEREVFSEGRGADVAVDRRSDRGSLTRSSHVESHIVTPSPTAALHRTVETCRLTVEGRRCYHQTMLCPDQRFIL